MCKRLFRFKYLVIATAITPVTGKLNIFAHWKTFLRSIRLESLSLPEINKKKSCRNLCDRERCFIFIIPWLDLANNKGNWSHKSVSVSIKDLPFLLLYNELLIATSVYYKDIVRVIFHRMLTYIKLIVDRDSARFIMIRIIVR